MQESVVIGILTTLFIITLIVQIYRIGLLAPTVNAFVFVFCLFLTLLIYSPLSILASIALSISKPLADILSFTLSFFALFPPLYLAFTKLCHILSESKVRGKHRLEKRQGLKTALATSTIWLLLIAATYNFLPINPFAKETSSSMLSVQIAKAALAFNAKPDKTFQQRIGNSIESLTESNKLVHRPNIPRDVRSEFDPIAEIEMFKLINEERRRMGLKALIFDTELRSVARSHSMDMVRGNFFDHVSPTTGTVADRMLAHGVFYLLVSENLACNTDVATANGDLLTSKEHHDSLMNDRLGKIGIGVVNSGQYGCMVTQVLTN